jgi:hypothetical protein
MFFVRAQKAFYDTKTTCFGVLVAGDSPAKNDMFVGGSFHFYT